MQTDEQRIIQGDCRAVLRTLPDESVQCIVTSPPYFGLRDYGDAEQIGLEQTPEQYVQEIVGVFREARRVLRHDGTLWLNIGDSYSRSAGDDRKKDTDTGLRTGRTGRSEDLFKGGNNRPPEGLKPKDLMGIPWRVAFALQADGWYLRQDIIWHKPNPMPESVKDRFTKAHEYVFLLSKSERYYFDHEAVQEPATGAAPGNVMPTKAGREVRNKRSVWTVATKPFPGAHFATFPPELVRPCVLAGSRTDDVVLDPFSGSGTTGEVALLAQRKYLGIEVNPVYVAMAAERLQRIQEQPGLFAEAARAALAGGEQ